MSNGNKLLGGTDYVDWRCEFCSGSGQEFPFCKSCKGNGWVDDPDDGGTMTCPDCNDEKCSECEGTGQKDEP